MTSSAASFYTVSPNVVVSSPTPSVRKGRRGRFCLFRRNKSPKAVVSTPTEVATPPPRCCLPRRAKRTSAVAGASRPTVHFSRTVQCDSTGATDFVNRSGTPKLVRRRSRSVKRTESRKSFYSAASTYSAVNRLRETAADVECCSTGDFSAKIEDSDSADDVALTAAAAAVVLRCTCAFPAHLQFDPSMPLTTPSDVERGSYEELLVHAKAQLGNWTTILSRSDSLDPQMVHVGIAKMKRMVMNRLAIPFTAVLEDNDTLLHCWITTPVGSKHTTAGLKGQVTEDKDSDLGDWSATTTIVDYPIKWFCGGRPVRAMQMKRENPALGVAYETRICLPDKAEGRILLYNITINPGNDKPQICVDRIYKFVSK